MPPFLTDLDPRAAVKGSRDPLGVQAIWTRFGRHVVGNLSTVSSSVRDFTILILGYYFAEKVAEAAGPGTELATFLKWEQLAAYSRAHVNHDTRFRGTERVQRNLKEGNIILCAETSHQILSNQKAYGIWGLYSWPGRASGLLEGQPAVLTLPARELVERVYLDALTQAGVSDGKRIIEILCADRTKLEPHRQSDKRLLEAVAGLLKDAVSPAEREFYRDHLLYGGENDSTERRQRQLATLIEPKLVDGMFAWTPAMVVALAKEAEVRGDAWHSLAHYLRRIETVERVLAPASELFTYLLGCDGVAVSEITRRMRQKDGWGNEVPTVSLSATADLRAELGDSDEAAGQRWLSVGEAMETGNYAQLITLLVQQNRAVMLGRGGAAWIEEEKGRLRVRVTEERGNLPRREDLPDLWRFPYFLDSLCSVASVLGPNAKKAP